MLKYVFMGSPPFAADNLSKLIEQVGPPVLVITQEPKARNRGQKVSSTAVGKFAHERQLPCLETANVNAPESLAKIRECQPDLMLVAAFGQILKNELLSLPKLFCLNVHGSLLPEYRGAAPIQRAIWDGKKETGITIQKMVRKLDAGDIFLQRRIAIEPNETSGELFDRLAQLGGDCLVESLKKIEENQFTLTPQEESLATYAAKISKEDSAINWNQSGSQIHNQIRALNPWPVAETFLSDEKLKIYRSRLTQEASNGEPGLISTDHRTFIKINTLNQKITLEEVQLQNRKRLNIPDFLSAFRGNFPYSRVSQKEATP